MIMINNSTQQLRITVLRTIRNISSLIIAARFSLHCFHSLLITALALRLLIQLLLCHVLAQKCSLEFVGLDFRIRFGCKGLLE